MHIKRHCSLVLVSQISTISINDLSDGTILPGHEECHSGCILDKESKQKDTELPGVPVHKNKVIFNNS